MDNTINGRMPEEIKQASHCVAWDESHCDDCAYRTYEDCSASAVADLLMYAQQLEAERDQYKRERDAAVKELRRTHNCNICKHHKKSGGTCDGWSVCGYNIPSWEWRGVQGEVE